jgi:CheY-like chemotaxis protein
MRGCATVTLPSWWRRSASAAARGSSCCSRTLVPAISIPLSASGPTPLLKPIVERDLAESIAAVLGGRRGAWGANLMPEGGHAASRRSAFAPSLRVLVAEDNEFNAQLMQALLARRGHDVQVARTGREALRLVEEGRYDVILLDIHMPEFDGFEVIRAIRERERGTGRHLPVIAVTARSRREDRERCIAAGMDDYLAKPIGVSDLWAAIERVTGA